MSDRVVARAQVQVTVEFAVGSSWEPNCPVSQIQDQAAEEAINELRRGLVIGGLGVSGSQARVGATIVGRPTVTAILVKEK